MNSAGAGLAISVNSPLVVSETIDGEAIIMHHGSGLYFDIVGTGAAMWKVIEQTTTAPALAASLCAGYGLAEAEAQVVVREWLAELAAHDLITFGERMVSVAVPTTQLADGIFVAPVLGVHADLADMLLLDPIHDVDEAGWPTTRAHA